MGSNMSTHLTEGRVYLSWRGYLRIWPAIDDHWRQCDIRLQEISYCCLSQVKAGDAFSLLLVFVVIMALEETRFTACVTRHHTCRL